MYRSSLLIQISFDRNKESPVVSMAPLDDIQAGDVVNVPGGMYGTVRFLGAVAGKAGRFAGVELAPEHAGRGKNSGDVDGRQYFTTSLPGSGIFVPINNSRYVTKRAPAATTAPPTPRPSATNFSKSVGPGTAPPSSVNRTKFRRPSLPRPESPRVGPPQKLNLTGLRSASSAYSRASPINGTPRTPLRTARPSSRPPSRMSVESTPISVKRSEMVRTPAFDDSEATDRIRVLEGQLRDRDKQLEDQATTLSDFQQSITELEGSDALQIRAQLREKNDRIAALTSEFDSHRADFRSTLDTLEVAASETERVYEKRIEELMQANHELQSRGEDVETVALQLKQLEELVSELEEGLEDARRGEAEARGEVEFLRGEVERTRLELKQEKEKSASTLKEAGSPADNDGQHKLTAKDLDQKDDEIRGLKAIIHSLSRGDVSTQAFIQQNGISQANNGNTLAQEDSERFSKMELRIQELEETTDRKSHRIEELEQEIEASLNAPSRNRSGTITTSPLRLHKAPPSGKDGSSAPRHTHTLSDRTVVPTDWHDSPQTSMQHEGRRLPTMQESDARSSSTDDGSSGWCEICETSGHDILTCTNMFGAGAGNKNAAVSPHSNNNNNANASNGGNGLGGRPSLDSTGFKGGSPSSQRTGRDVVLEGLKGIGGLSSSMAPIAGKNSGVIDDTKWCALCERDGHESIDCPFDE